MPSGDSIPARQPPEDGLLLADIERVAESATRTRLELDQAFIVLDHVVRERDWALRESAALGISLARSATHTRRLENQLAAYEAILAHQLSKKDQKP